MKKYYAGLAFFGLVSEIVVALGITGLRSIKDVQWSPFLGGFILTIIAATGVTFWTADYVSRRPYSAKIFSKIIFNPFLIFVSGILTGTFINFLYQGIFLDPTVILEDNFHTWFIKPFSWLMLVGGPSSIIVGIIYYPLTIVMDRINTSRN